MADKELVRKKGSPKRDCQLWGLRMDEEVMSKLGEELSLEEAMDKARDIMGSLQDYELAFQCVFVFRRNDEVKCKITNDPIKDTWYEALPMVAEDVPHTINNVYSGVETQKKTGVVRGGKEN